MRISIPGSSSDELSVNLYYLLWRGWDPEDIPKSLGNAPQDLGAALRCGQTSERFLNLHLLEEPHLGEPQKVRIAERLLPLIQQSGTVPFAIPVLMVDSPSVVAFLKGKLKNDISGDRGFWVYPLSENVRFNIGSDQYFLRRDGRWLGLFSLGDDGIWRLVRLT